MSMPLPYLIQTTLQNPRVALLGTCVSEELAQTALARNWPVHHYLMESVLPVLVPELAADDLDAVLVHLTLRGLFGLAVERGGEDIFHLRPDLDWSALEERARQLLNTLVQQTLAGLPAGLPVFFISFVEPMAPIRGLLGENRRQSLYALVRSLNDSLEEIVAGKRHAFYLEVNDLRLFYGDQTAYDGYVTHFTHGMIRRGPQGDLIHHAILDRVQAGLEILQGERQIKLIITDLDNTLWEGVAAELDEIVPAELREGWPMGYAEALLACKARGILLAICSKNEDEAIRALFPQIWGDRLRLEDFCSIQIGWMPKPQAIARILAETNILPEHVLFIDDNHLEIDEVHSAYPQMQTLSGNPEIWRQILLYAPELQFAQISVESARRTELIQAKKQREQEALTLDRATWLASLQLMLQIEEIRDDLHPRYGRALELLNKTNQFNTTGKRWSNAELQDWLAGGGNLLAVSAEDRYAPHGLIAIALLQGPEILQVVLSCRVFGLGIEAALLSEAVRRIQEQVQEEFWGHFVATGRNDTCRDFWQEQGCQWDTERGLWRGSRGPQWPTWVRKKEHFQD